MGDSIFSNDNFWYYFILVLILIIIGWISVLMNYPSKYYKVWPHNLKQWDYTSNSILPLVLWTISLILFMFGAYESDSYDSYGKIITLFRLLFFVIVFLNIISFYLFYVEHNIIATLISHLFSLILLIGLILSYTSHNSTNGWLLFPYFVIMVFYTYSLWFIYKSNDTTNDLFNLGL